jgi:hypothetical protein
VIGRHKAGKQEEEVEGMTTQERSLQGQLIRLVRITPAHLLSWLRQPPRKCSQAIARRYGSFHHQVLGSFRCCGLFCHVEDCPAPEHPPPLALPQEAALCISERAPALTRRHRRLQGGSLAFSVFAAWISSVVMKRVLYPPPKGAQVARKRLAAVLGVPPHKLYLNEYELQLVPKVIGPREFNVGLDDVAGLPGVIETLVEDTRFMCAFPAASDGSMLEGAKGLLLYGPSGTGKTMMAKVRAWRTWHAFCPFLVLVYSWCPVAGGDSSGTLSAWTCLQSCGLVRNAAAFVRLAMAVTLLGAPPFLASRLRSKQDLVGQTRPPPEKAQACPRARSLTRPRGVAARALPTPQCRHSVAISSRKRICARVRAARRCVPHQHQRAAAPLTCHL